MDEELDPRVGDEAGHSSCRPPPDRRATEGPEELGGKRRERNIRSVGDEVTGQGKQTRPEGPDKTGRRTGTWQVGVTGSEGVSFEEQESGLSSTPFSLSLT